MSMSNGRDLSLAQLEREAARNRAALMGTVDALQSRISPSAIKQDVQEYVRDKKDGLLRNLERRARENPLQTAVIAAGAAYPLWRIITSLPAPLLLIGAGLALTRRSGQNTANNDGSFVGAARQHVGAATDTLKQKFDDVSETVHQRIEQTMQSARQTSAQVSDRLLSLKSDAAESAEGLTATIGDRLSETATAARSMSSEAVAAASDMMSAGYRSGAEMAGRAGEQMVHAGQRTQETFVDTVQRHPMIVAAVGLAIGAAIASAFPATRREEQLFGAAGGEFKKKATALALEGVDAAKTAAEEVYQDTLRYAKDQGLSSEGVQQAAKNIGEKVNTVIANATEGSGEQNSPTRPYPSNHL